MTTKFIEIIVQNYKVIHGFDNENKEIEEYVTVPQATKKLINTNRILSVSEKFILISYGFDRIIYWEYLDNYKAIAQKLACLPPHQ